MNKGEVLMCLSCDLCLCACRKLIDLGWSKEYINQMVKEKAISESESIYGTLYGALVVDEQDNM